MEPATTSSSLYGVRDEERSAGGKLRKPSGRKPPATPYSRPSANPCNTRPAGGWWSKLVDPAKRLASGGATMLLPTFFSQSASAAVLPTAESQDKLDVEVSLNANKDESHSLSHFVPKFTGFADPSKIFSVKSETNCSSKGHGERSNNSEDNSEISRIEQLIEGNNFSRDEVNRLMEILTSKVEGEERKFEITMSRRAEEVLRTPSSMIPDEGNQRDADKDISRTPVPFLQPNASVHNAVGASPVDIAKAYMGSRSLECDPSPRSAVTKRETTANQTDEVVLNPLTALTPIESSTCWPGAMVHDPRDNTTPRPRTRYGLHDFPRTTPYSRTIRSKSRDMLQTDSRLLRTSPNPYQQSRTPIFGKEKIHNPIAADDSYGSVGPNRHVGHKSAADTKPRGSNIPDSKVYQQKNVSDRIIPPPDEVPEKSMVGIGFTEPAAHLNPYPNQTVKRILEQLDTKKPTPKEMAAELKLATSWRNPKITDKFSKKTDRENTKLAETSSNGQHVMSTSVHNQNKFEVPQHRSGSKPNLVYISMSRNDVIISRAPSSSSSENGCGFTFPISTSSSALSEPPTPSIMPFSSNNSLPKEEPSYSFGSMSATPTRLVFSFPPSSTSPQVDDSGLKFDFGTDQTTRLSFDSLGKDGICY